MDRESAAFSYATTTTGRLAATVVAREPCGQFAVGLYRKASL
ncbi:hypothetical protein NRB56_75170 [Nocardia sp. RB56]|uniref:Uncharacterized protein n=1 Tax=Nocardia aurantia TaxID=2585199 RepID=A0A7K0E1M2_9NOCA|nr:hypothetical protein [Nocardia aurantia]